MRINHPTDDELRENFEEMLQSVRRGGGLWSDSGLDMETEEALWAIARAYTNVPDELVDAARAAFAGQLDGSHARAHREKLERMFEEIKGRRADR